MGFLSNANEGEFAPNLSAGVRRLQWLGFDSAEFYMDKYIRIGGN